MEDDDEFGDLYTDVLQPFTSSSAPQPSVIQSTSPSLSRPIDLNTQNDDDDDEILFGARNSKPSFNFTSSNQPKTLVFESKKEAPELNLAGFSDSRRNLNSGDVMVNQEVEKEEDIDGIGKNRLSDSALMATESRVLESGGDVRIQKRTFEDPNFVDESGIDIIVDERNDEDDILVAEDVGKSVSFQNFDKTEVDNGIGDLGSEPIIPGISITGISDANFVSKDEAGGDGDDWDSDDSEDDLQIVLNDSNHGPMTMDMGGGLGEDEDEDDDPLVIVADGDQNHLPLGEQQWGEDAAQGADGERKEVGDAAKVIGGVVVPPKIGFINHGFHPFHSQFKYVRPGATPIPGAAPASSAGVPSQVRPQTSMVPIAGRGRGDWRPTGMKSFYPGFGTSGRAFGLEFTLPSYKTIFEVEVDSFEEKPWKLPGIDLSDFFNFDLNEESWKGYCKQLELLRLGSTMPNKIHVYESGRTEQEYDPDMPPELAAATGIHDIFPENANFGKTDAGQRDLANVAARVRPPLPTGRPIQVECGYGERLPSIDTRPPRIRDSDAIIEIVLQDSADDDSVPENDLAEQPVLGEDLKEAHEIVGDVENDDTEHFDGTDGTLPSSQEAPHEERQTKGRTRDTSPDMTSEGTQDKKICDNHKEESVKSIDGKHSPRLPSPVSNETTREHDELVMADGTTDFLKDEKLMHSLKRQKPSSQVEQFSLEEIDDADDVEAARSSENSKARSGSSRDYQKLHDGVEQEVLQDRRSTRTGNIKRPVGENEQSLQRKCHDDRLEIKRHRMVANAREDSYYHRDRDINSVHHLRVKTEGVERRKERENSDEAFQWRDNDPHSIRNRTERGEEVGSRHQLKVRESERSFKDELLQSRKEFDNGSWRAHQVKDMGSRHRERSENLKSQYENMDDQRNIRRKEESLRRDHAEKEKTAHRKRERDDVLDHLERDDQARPRDDEHYSVRHKEENWFQKERSERPRERERDGGQGTRSGRAVEDKVWVSQGRVRDEYKGSERDYQFKDVRYESEQIKRRDRVENGSLSHYRGHDVHAHGDQLSNDERRSTQERASTRRDRAVNASDNHRATEKRHKESTRKSKESGGGHNSSSGLSKKYKEDLSNQINEKVISKGASEREVPVNHHSSRKHKEIGSSDDEQQDSRRGRSKFERWTSHKERDFSINSKSSPSLKIKEMDRYSNGRSSLPRKLLDESSKTVESIDEKDGGDLEIEKVDTKLVEERQSDTVAKLRKRSERFKPLMPSEKDTVPIKKMESEPLPLVQSETFADSEIKQERPPRKRRWIGN